MVEGKEKREEKKEVKEVVKEEVKKEVTEEFGQSLIWSICYNGNPRFLHKMLSIIDKHFTCSCCLVTLAHI